MFANRPEQSAAPRRERMSVQSFIHLRERILIGTSEAFVLINYQDLLMCESYDLNTLVVTRDGREFIVSESLSRISDSLPSHLFVRPTSTHLVLREAIRKMEADRIELENGFEIVSRAEVARDQSSGWNRMVNWKTQVSKVMMAIW